MVGLTEKASSLPEVRMTSSVPVTISQKPPVYSMIRFYFSDPQITTISFKKYMRYNSKEKTILRISLKQANYM